MDVGAGYTGVTNFHPVLVSVLICLNTYGARVLLPLVYLHARDPALIHFRSTRILSILRTLELTFFLAVVTAQRYHLFVWTVFSPKLLYEFTQTLVVTLVMTLLALARHALA